MTAVKFVNATQHALTQEQIEAAKTKFGVSEITQLSDLDPELFGKLKNVTTTSPVTLLGLAYELIRTLESVGGTVYVHLPIGSPAFMFILSQRLAGSPDIRPVFSHTERMVEETMNEKGEVVKVSKFLFKDFIVF